VNERVAVSMIARPAYPGVSRNKAVEILAAAVVVVAMGAKRVAVDPRIEEGVRRRAAVGMDDDPSVGAIEQVQGNQMLKRNCKMK